MKIVNEIPTLNWHIISQENGCIDSSSDSIKSLAKDLSTILKEIGFVYILNHGIQSNEVQAVEEKADEFFDLPIDVKIKFKRGLVSPSGYNAIGSEKFNQDNPGDYKEAFNITPSSIIEWPDKYVSNFQPTMESFIEKSYAFGLQFLKLMAIGLGLKDENIFIEKHGDIKSNCTTLRCLSYPPLPCKSELQLGQTRCGEHTDYGSITLLFQNSFGGLQVMNREGHWINAVPVKDAIVVNIGDLMQRWTSDVLLSSKHRVPLPEDELARSHCRKSYVFFMYPAHDALIECIDGSNKYEKINALEYLQSKLAQINRDASEKM